MSGAQDDREAAIRRTRHWLERVVIGLGLCPFAQAPYRAGRIAYVVCEETAHEAIYRSFLAALQDLVLQSAAEQETALLIVSRGLRDFAVYLELLDVLEEAIVEAGLEGVIQVASFHPDYCFDGVAESDPANYSNRSPLPMFHLIREDGLAAALEGFAEPEQIPQRNVRRLRELGLAGLRLLLERAPDEDATRP